MILIKFDDSSIVKASALYFKNLNAEKLGK